MRECERARVPVRCPWGACASLCCRDLRDKEPLQHAPAFFPGSGLDLLPNSEPVATIREGAFKLYERLKDKALIASGVALETPRLPTPPRANMSHVDPSFETATAT